MNTVFFKNLGIVDFKHAWDTQESILNSLIEKKRSKKNRSCAGYLLFCQHPHVYTLGKSGDYSNLLLNNKELSDKNASFYKINRGGDITYHGPGQLVIYPIFDLDFFFTDIHKYLRFLEDIVIGVLSDYSIFGERIAGSTGVWIGEKEKKKICAIGVRASRWVTMHGLAFNINVNLEYFNNIVPCGISDKGVTSLNKVLGSTVNFKDVEKKFYNQFKKVFNINIEDAEKI